MNVPGNLHSATECPECEKNDDDDKTNASSRDRGGHRVERVESGGIQGILGRHSDGVGQWDTR